MSTIEIAMVAGCALGLLIFSGLLAVSVVRLRQLKAAFSALQTQQKKVNKELETQRHALVKISRLVGKHQKHLSEVKHQMEKQSLKVAGQPSYSQAVRMIERGENVQGLVELCGLSRGEAELLVKMHGASNISQERAEKAQGEEDFHAF